MSFSTTLLERETLWLATNVPFTWKHEVFQFELIETLILTSKGKPRYTIRHCHKLSYQLISKVNKSVWMHWSKEENIVQNYFLQFLAQLCWYNSILGRRTFGFLIKVVINTLNSSFGIIWIFAFEVWEIFRLFAFLGYVPWCQAGTRRVYKQLSMCNLGSQ